MKDILVEWRKYLKEGSEDLQIDPKIVALVRQNQDMYNDFLELGLVSEEMSHENFISHISNLMQLSSLEAADSIKEVVETEEIKTKKDLIRRIQSSNDFKSMEDFDKILDDSKKSSCRCETNPICCIEGLGGRAELEQEFRDLKNNVITILNHYIDIASKDLPSGEDASDFIRRTCDLNVELGFMPKTEYDKCLIYLKRNPNKCPDYMNKDPKSGECLPFIDKETAEKLSKQAIIGGMQFFARIKRTCDTAVKAGLIPEQEYSKCFAFKTKYPNKCPSKMKMKNGECVIEAPWAAPSSMRN